MPFLTLYPNPQNLNTHVMQVGCIEEELFEIFDLIQEFRSTNEFASWITDKKFQSVIYKNETSHEKHISEWVYTFEQQSFFFGKFELDEKKLPEDINAQFNRLNSIFCGIKESLAFEKMNIHSVLTDFHYTIISHIIYKGLITGKLWEIYNLPNLLKIYEQKQDPLRYWKKTRRE